MYERVELAPGENGCSIPRCAPYFPTFVEQRQATCAFNTPVISSFPPPDSRCARECIENGIDYSRKARAFSSIDSAYRGETSISSLSTLASRFDISVDIDLSALGAITICVQSVTIALARESTDKRRESSHAVRTMDERIHRSRGESPAPWKKSAPRDRQGAPRSGTPWH